MRALKVFVLAFVVAGAATAGVLAAIIPARTAPINVRWRPDVTSSQRADLEGRFHLANGHLSEGTTWSYDLTDTSFVNVRAIVRHPAVDDTAHINRRLFRPAFAFDREARVAIGGVIGGALVSLLLLVRSNVRTRTRAPVVMPERMLIRMLAPAPGVLLAAATLLLLLAAVGFHPLWANPALPLAQAARGGDAATVYRMLSAGADPNVAQRVRFERRAEPAVLTPLEAAVESRQVEVVQLLAQKGAPSSDADRARLACLAKAVDAPEVAVYLQSTMPPSSPPECERIPLPVH